MLSEKYWLMDLYMNQDLNSEFAAQGKGGFNVFFAGKFLIKEPVLSMKINIVKSICEGKYTKNGYDRLYQGKWKSRYGLNPGSS
jgi:hypothetical protein